MLRFVLLLLSALSLANFAAPAQKTDAERGKPKDPFAGFYWIDTASGNRGVVLERRTLVPLALDPRAQVASDIQTEVLRPDAGTMRIVRRTYNRDVNGRSQVVEMVTEDVRVTPNNGFSATRSITRLDANGRMVQVEQASQETVAAGAGSYRTQATVARGSGSLARAEEIVQVETRKADGTVEIDRTNFRPGSSGSMAAAERHVSSSKEAGGQVTGQEDVYLQNVNGALALARSEVSREWKESGSTQRAEIDTHLPDSTGRMQLNARALIVSTGYADGSRQVTQTTSRANPATPLQGLQLSEKLIQTDRPADGGATEREIEMQKPDVNGRMQTIVVQRITEKK